MHEQLNKVHTVYRPLPEFAINRLNFANQLIPFKLRPEELFYPFMWHQILNYFFQKNSLVPLMFQYNLF